jgi:hypothetical protein
MRKVNLMSTMNIARTGLSAAVMLAVAIGHAAGITRNLTAYLATLR